MRVCSLNGSTGKADGRNPARTHIWDGGFPPFTAALRMNRTSYPCSKGVVSDTLYHGFCNYTARVPTSLPELTLNTK